MKYKILLITIAALGVGCNSAYRSTQTPDDVYYSPVRPMGEEESKQMKKISGTARKTARSGCRGTTGGGGNLTMITIAGTIPHHYGYSYGYYYNPYYYPLPGILLHP